MWVTNTWMNFVKAYDFYLHISSKGHSCNWRWNAVCYRSVQLVNKLPNDIDSQQTVKNYNGGNKKVTGKNRGAANNGNNKKTNIDDAKNIRPFSRRF